MTQLWEKQLYCDLIGFGKPTKLGRIMKIFFFRFYVLGIVACFNTEVLLTVWKSLDEWSARRVLPKRTAQHRITRTDIHASGGIRTYDSRAAKTHALDRAATVIG
jgi:hypothetical protein